MRDTLIVNANSVVKNVTIRSSGGECWIAARPMGYPSLRYRIKAAWLVFTGKADALVWAEADAAQGGTGVQSSWRHVNPGGDA